VRLNNRLLLKLLARRVGVAGKTGACPSWPLEPLGTIDSDAVTAEMVREAGTTDERARRARRDSSHWAGMQDETPLSWSACAATSASNVEGWR